MQKEHWEKVYTSKAASEVSWFQERAELSLRLIQEAGIGKEASLIDVGGGASTLVDDLLALGYEDLTVLDLSGAALETAKARLGAQAARVHWQVADIRTAVFAKHRFDVWHDRAVFHFLTEEADKQKYVEQVLHAVKPGGWVMVATFAEDGPTRCSGLPVARYSPDELHGVFGEPFSLIQHVRESHYTPAGSEQKFVYCFCRKEAI